MTLFGVVGAPMRKEWEVTCGEAVRSAGRSDRDQNIGFLYQSGMRDRLALHEVATEKSDHRGQRAESSVSLSDYYNAFYLKCAFQSTQGHCI